MAGIENQQHYLSANLVQWLVLSKSTLFRWEREGDSLKPMRSNGNRLYSREVAVRFAERVVRERSLLGLMDRMPAEQELAKAILPRYFINPMGCLMTLEDMLGSIRVPKSVVDILATDALRRMKDEVSARTWHLFFLNERL